MIAGGGHSAFSASSQDAGVLGQKFSPVDPATPLSDIPITLGDDETVVLAERDTPLMLVNFWATWCGPCVEEMPSLNELQADMGGDDFEVVAISLDRQGMDVVQPFFAENGITALKPYIDKEGDFSRAMEAVGLPVTLLVKDGKVVRKIVGPADWASPEAKEIIRQYM